MKFLLCSLSNSLLTLDQRNSLWSLYLGMSNLMSQSATITSWSEIPGITLIDFSRLGLSKQNKSRILPSPVGSFTILLKAKCPKYLNDFLAQSSFPHTRFLLEGSVGTQFSKILVKIATIFQGNAFEWRPFCLGLNVLTWVVLSSWDELILGHKLVTTSMWLLIRITDSFPA